MQIIYDKTQDNAIRYTLGEINEGERVLICFGINPSTATPEKLDPTLRKVKLLSQVNGYDSWIMLNLYPQRATNPNDMHRELFEEIHKTNMEFVRKTLENHTNTSDVLFAYGNLIDKRKYLSDCLSGVQKIMQEIAYGGKSLCIKKTKCGNPVHPLYQKNDSTFTDF